MPNKDKNKAGTNKKRQSKVGNGKDKTKTKPYALVSVANYSLVKMTAWSPCDGDCSLVRRFCSPKVRESEIKGSSFRRFYSPKVRKSEIRVLYSPKAL